MSQEQPPPDGFSTHGPASSGPSLLSTTAAPSTIPDSTPFGHDTTPMTILNPATTTTTSTSTISSSSTSNDKRPIPEEINNWARTIYNYHRMRQPLPSFSLQDSAKQPQSTRILFVLCSLDLRVAYWAAHIFLCNILPPSPPWPILTTPPGEKPPIRRGAYKYLVFSGHSGVLTRSLTGDPSSSSSSPVTSGGAAGTEKEKEVPIRSLPLRLHRLDTRSFAGVYPA